MRFKAIREPKKGCSMVSAKYALKYICKVKKDY